MSFRVCVNISPLQFNQPDLVHYIRSFLDRSGLDPERLELELTESAIMTDGGANIDKLNQLKSLGLDLAIDDFGTGYSSLSYLKRFPINTLKIDQSFVADMNSPDGVAIVDAILALARTLNLRSIAEGIETKDQLAYLAERGCDLMQGYYFDRPLYPEDIPEAVRRDYSRDIERALADSKNI
jgi:EAL domain-containing protein (putative c-di-GMP-specific phosphodiesterase class I)